MEYKTYQPSPALSKLVSEFYVFKNYSNELPSPQRITPDGCYEINFNFGDPVLRSNIDASKIQLSNSYLTSRFLSSYFVQRTGLVKIVGVRLFPWGIKPLTNLSSAETLDELIPLELVFGNRVNSFYSELENCQFSDIEAVQKLQNFLISQLPQKYEFDELVVEASKLIRKSSGIISIKTLAENFGICSRRLEQRFKASIGISPKSYAKLIAFQMSINLIANKSISLTEIAISSGYFDQSHFIRDFKRFTGTSPLKYYKESNSYNNLVITAELARDFTYKEPDILILYE